MIKRYANMLVFISLLLLSLTIGAYANGEAGQSGNLIINAGFEETDLDSRQDSKVWLTSEWAYKQYGAVVGFHIDDQVARTGSRSLRIRGLGSPGVPRGTVRQAVSLDEFPPGSTYRVTAWFKADGITNRQSIAVRLTFKKGSKALPSNLIEPTNTNYFRKEGSSMFHVYPKTLPIAGWVPVEAVLKAPEDANNLNVELFLWQDVGTIWWDDITVELVD